MIKNILSKKSFILLNVIYLYAAFIIVIIPLIAWSVNEYGWTSRSFKAIQALNLADAGAELAVWDIVYNDAQFTTWSGTNPKTLTITSFQNNLGTAIGDIMVSADNTSPGNYFITSRGFVPDRIEPAGKKTVKVKVFPHALFNNSLFGNSSVAIGGNSIVDSYDSSISPYSPLTARDNGDVGSNGSLTLAENGLVKGDLFIGPNGSVSGNTDARLTGDTYYFGNEVELEPVSLPEELTMLPSLSNLNVSGKSELTIPTGNYVYNNIFVQSLATLTISNNTKIYIVSDFNIAGQATVFTGIGVEIYIGGSGSFEGMGIVNLTSSPNNLNIYGLSGNSTLYFAGQSDFAGTIYAPYSDVIMGGNASYFGAAVGNTITLSGNGGFHYDENLSQGGPFSGYDIAYWQED